MFRLTFCPNETSYNQDPDSKMDSFGPFDIVTKFYELSNFQIEMNNLTSWSFQYSISNNWGWAQISLVDRKKSAFQSHHKEKSYFKSKSFPVLFILLKKLASTLKTFLQTLWRKFWFEGYFIVGTFSENSLAELLN